MSEQVSRKHGPVEDEAIKRQDRHDLELEGEERPDREWLGEGEAALDWASRDLTDRAAALPATTFASLHDVVAALGLSIEHRVG